MNIDSSEADPIRSAADQQHTIEAGREGDVQAVDSRFRVGCLLSKGLF